MLSRYDNLIMCDGMMYVALKVRKSYMARSHKGLQGIGKTRRCANLHFLWLKMTFDFQLYVTHHNACICNSSDKQETLRISPLPESLWQEMGLDVFEHVK